MLRFFLILLKSELLLSTKCLTVNKLGSLQIASALFFFFLYIFTFTLAVPVLVFESLQHFGAHSVVQNPQNSLIHGLGLGLGLGFRYLNCRIGSPKNRKFLNKLQNCHFHYLIPLSQTLILNSFWFFAWGGASQLMYLSWVIIMGCLWPVSFLILLDAVFSFVSLL